jgi:hypothetical protein
LSRVPHWGAFTQPFMVLSTASDSATPAVLTSYHRGGEVVGSRAPGRWHRESHERGHVLPRMVNAVATYPLIRALCSAARIGRPPTKKPQKRWRPPAGLAPPRSGAAALCRAPLRQRCPSCESALNCLPGSGESESPDMSRLISRLRILRNS